MDGLGVVAGDWRNNTFRNLNMVFAASLSDGSMGGLDLYLLYFLMWCMEACFFYMIQ